MHKVRLLIFEPLRLGRAGMNVRRDCAVYKEGSSQDIVQETFLRAWRSADRFDPGLASLRVWLFAIARNVITDHHRAVGARPWLRGLTDEPQDAGRSVADHAEHLVDEWVIREALDRIGEDQRHALTETYLRDRPYAEVAAEVGI